MKITFAAATLAEDAASPRIAAVIEQWGGQSLVQTEPLYGGSNLAKFPRGNVGGLFIFTAGCSYASRDLAAAAFAAAWSRLNTQGALAVQPAAGGATLTMANAILRDVSRVEWAGVWLKLRFTFEITTVTNS